MKRLSLTICTLWLTAVALAQVSFGEARQMNENWLFLRVDTGWNTFESADMRLPDFDDSRWRHVTLPHDWGVELPMSPDKGSCQGYLPGGIGWYRHHFKLNLKNGERYFIYFEGVYNHSEVYVNGQLLGMRPSGFASFLYDMTPYLREENVLAVRVNHSAEADSRWYTGSGINRNVWIVTAPVVHLAQWGTAYRLKSISEQKAFVEVDVETTDEEASDTKASQQREKGRLWAVVEMKDAEGKVVATAKTAIGSQEKRTITLTLKDPQRWTLDRPYLYTLHTRLMENEKEIDHSEVKAGLRTLEFSADKGFALNGERMKIKGVCIHDDAGVLGTAVPAEVWHRRLVELKRIGTNAIRLSHNPHAPELYDLCDELGLLVMDEASDEWEFPKRKWMRGWNQGKPGFEGTYTYFEEWIERDVADMVRRDRCHPCVFLWSIGNEVDYPNDPYSHPVLDGGGSRFTQPMYGGYKPEQPNAERIGHIAKKLAKVVKDIDGSRPTTGALAGVVMSNETLYPKVIDVVGYNYTESRYAEDHQKYPERIIYGSENRHDLAAWKAVRDNEHIFGQFLWTGIDYLGESGVWPARGSSAGLLDLAGQRKPNGWYRAALWSKEPVCYIGTYPVGPQRFGSRNNNQRSTQVSAYASDTWNYTEGQRIRVVCYTNAASARLTLNGETVGGEAQRDANTDILYWDIDFKPGTLRCEADNNASYEVKTTKRPHAIRLTSDGGMHVFVEVVDEDGNLVKQADNEVTLTVRGAKLLGMENGNMQGAQGGHPSGR
ncbi:MAG: DUF4982 domain-containing protein, partial [Bacteroidaceae bacterium]|nr:DUF4982 domain-containing protein [Bacteroidaceae bacterium]